MSEMCGACGRDTFEELAKDLTVFGACWRSDCWRVAYEREKARADEALARLDKSVAGNHDLAKRYEEAERRAREEQDLAEDWQDRREAAEQQLSEARAALETALSFAGHHVERGTHWIASESFGDDDCPCQALAAQPHPLPVEIERPRFEPIEWQAIFDALEFTATTCGLVSEAHLCASEKVQAELARSDASPAQKSEPPSPTGDAE